MLEERVRRYSEREGTSLNAARKILDREDAARARFLRHNYGSDGTNPADYDFDRQYGTDTARAGCRANPRRLRSEICSQTRGGGKRIPQILIERQ